MELEKFFVLDLKQKSRVRWAVEGEENTKKFHGHINNKNKRDKIEGLMVNGARISTVEEVKKETLNFFKHKFIETHQSGPKLVSPYFKSISMMEAIKLEAPFTMDEIKDAVWAFGNDKASGPDRYTFKFIKAYWDVLKEDVFKFVLHFDKFGTIARGCNSSFITLAPKIKDPSSLSYYRPISLICCMYKIISKALATRLKAVIGVIIGEVQSVYVEDINILDGALVINEVHTWAMKMKKKRFYYSRLISINRLCNTPKIQAKHFVLIKLL